jgi:hypothetical protein
MLSKPQGAAGCKSSADRQWCSTPGMISKTPKLATDMHVARCGATNCAVDGSALTCKGKVLGMRQRGLGTPRNRSQVLAHPVEHGLHAYMFRQAE